MISTKGRYALRVMIDLAETGMDRGVPLKDVASRQDISKKYLESIVKDLVKAGLVSGASGRGGGYRLTKPPEEYSVGEILEATEGPFAIVACLSKDSPACPRADGCRTLPLWEEFGQMAKDFFFSKKLTDLTKSGSR